MTALQIYKEALEDIAAMDDGMAERSAADDARAALDAAAKVGGLADDESALQCFAVDVRLQSQDEISKAILRNIDAYQRGAR